MTETHRMREDDEHAGNEPGGEAEGRERHGGPGAGGRRAAVIVLAAVAAQALLVLAFVVPGHKPEPHDVPVVVVGPPEAAAAVQERADQVRPGGFEITPVADPPAAERAILDRDAYGALIPDEELLTASAASFPVAQMLEAAFPAPETRDVRPLDPDDPRGATLGLLGIPLIVVCLPVGFLLARLPLRQCIAATLAFAALAGLAVTAALNVWIGALPGDYLPLAGFAALTVAAVVFPAVGLVRLIGPPGLLLVAVVVLFIGNPGSGAASAPELLPGFWRAVGPLLPPGAGTTGLRNVAYFDGAALTRPLIVLAAFALAGLALIIAARGPRPGRTHAAA
jgi:hypothetical protein